MDTTRFDRLARTLAGTPSRRAVAGLLLGLTVSGVALPMAGESTAATRPCKPCRRKRRGTCRGKKPDGTACGARRECCNGNCVAVCAANQLRDPGTCRCCLRGGEPCEPGPAACCAKMCVAIIGQPAVCRSLG